ncbi:hypothetical protein E4U17_000667 [Claviceps sp. LM77 group G4]|nr:hypothetical protein E4U17_000667 [Claviceps sp. LM77 group G4]
MAFLRYATVGKNNQPKLNRKTIQGVNVPKACQKIIDPGAPLALRLQGNLLYGVSRVFAHQCNYVLSDAEKTQSDMMTFFRSMNTSEIDPKAGKAKYVSPVDSSIKIQPLSNPKPKSGLQKDKMRQQIMLQDDPQFDPLAMIPRLDAMLAHEAKLHSMPMQESGPNFSQLSPLDLSAISSMCTSRRSSMVGLDLPPSSHSVGSYQLPGNLCHSSPFNKAFQEAGTMQDSRPFDDHDTDLDPIHGMGLEFDADGNLVSIMDAEPELPPLRATSSDPLHTAGPTLPQVGRRVRHQLSAGLNEDNFLDFGEDVLPDAEPFAVAATQPTAGQTRNDGVLTLTTETTESDQISATAHLGVAHGRRFRTMVDQEVRVSRDEFRTWSDNYAANMHSARKRVKGTTLAKAKANALQFMYGNGISSIGALQQDFGVQHPLAAEFAGTVLQARLLGLSIDVTEQSHAARGRRRKSPGAFGQEEEDEDGQGYGKDTRNVKQRRLETPADELGRRGEENVDFGDELLHFGDDSAPEIGMRAAPAMDDKNSSMLAMPWSRQGSAVPGSATRAAPGSAQKPLHAPSPLHGRGSVVGSIERHSDPIEDPFHDIGLGSQHSSMLLSSHGLENTNHDTQTSVAGLDISSHDFLDYVTEQIHHHGAPSPDTRDNKRWIRFEQLASPEVHSKMVAAQAFMHILSLATKNVVSVRQEGVLDKNPFGVLHIGFAAEVGRI